MKLPPTHKLIKLCLTQSLLQSGFQRTSSSSLTTFANVVEYLIFNLILKIKEIPSDLAYKILLKNNDFSNDIFQLLKLCRGTGDSVLHVMNIIPKNMDWRGKGGGVKLIKEGGEVLESVYDDFVYNFIDDTDRCENKDIRNDNAYNNIMNIHYKNNNEQQNRDINVKDSNNAHNNDIISNDNNNVDTIEYNSKNKLKHILINEKIKYTQIVNSDDKLNQNCNINNNNTKNILEAVCDENDICNSTIKKAKTDNYTNFIDDKAEKHKNNIDNYKFDLDNLVASITNKKGWFNEKDYKLLLENKRKRQKFLNCYNSAFENNLIDEFKFLTCKEVCKIRKNSKK